jgi:5-methyltetrahydropteroyltriglutamate--homocysteine methyltransferase
MTEIRFVTREIGSLAKPSWRVKAFAGRPLEEGDLREAESWGRRLDVDGFERLSETLRSGRFSEAELAEIDDWAALYAIGLLEKTGLDVVYDGEQRRTEMYDHVAAFARGFEQRGTVRSFDNKYYTKAAVVDQPSVPGPQDVDELRFVQEHTDRELKVPLTGSSTMEDWS